MKLLKFRTHISGYNTNEETPYKEGKPSEEFVRKHFVCKTVVGKLNPEKIREIAADIGIVRDLEAVATRFKVVETFEIHERERLI